MDLSFSHSHNPHNSLQPHSGFHTIQLPNIHRSSSSLPLLPHRKLARNLHHRTQIDTYSKLQSSRSQISVQNPEQSHAGFSVQPLRRRTTIGSVHFENRHRNGEIATDFEHGERPPFDLDLAVVLAGFAFEAYNSPEKNVGVHEKDVGDCQTTYLALHYLREVYDGQIIVKLKKGMHFPGLDFWGTSDPYVVLRCGDCEAQSKVAWATKDPVWNEELRLNVKHPESKNLQIAAWDANVVTAHRRMGNTRLSLNDLSDGKKHEVELQLGGMGGGGAIQLEVRYESFKDAEKSWWRLPSFTDLLQLGGMDGVYKKLFGEDGISAGDFVRSTLGSLPVLLEGKEDTKVQLASKAEKNDTENEITNSEKTELSTNGTTNKKWFGFRKTQQTDISKESKGPEQGGDGDYVRAVVQAVGNTLASLEVDVGNLPVFDKNTMQADGKVMNKLSSEFQSKAEVEYVENGLAIPNKQNPETLAEDDSQNLQPNSEQLQNASNSLLLNTENFLGMWATVARFFPGARNEDSLETPTTVETGDSAGSSDDAIALDEDCDVDSDDEEEKEAKRQMFQTAESAVEAWAMLATSVRGQSFVKSEFEKICFLENTRTDTEVAIWRDATRCRLIFAFRGTEQTKWKDLSTDMNIIPVGFNPERIGGDFKEEAMVHGGFLNAYDSVRRRLMTLLQASVGISDMDENPSQNWQIYSTGHSLGGALATLFALELSSSKLAKKGHIQVTMYNFGSPRVGNKRFADNYNQAVKDSWRVVNHRDIIPTVPRLMGYCHVAQPIYLSTGDLAGVVVESGHLQDGYHGDVIGEVTPDFVFENFMKGERKILEKLLQTEIAMLRAIRDGSALMQHMEDFYYIALLERVKQKVARRLK